MQYQNSSPAHNIQLYGKDILLALAKSSWTQQGNSVSSSPRCLFLFLLTAERTNSPYFLPHALLLQTTHSLFLFPYMDPLLLTSWYISTWSKDKEIIIIDSVSKNKKENNHLLPSEHEEKRQIMHPGTRAISLELWRMTWKEKNPSRFSLPNSFEINCRNDNFLEGKRTLYS